MQGRAMFLRSPPLPGDSNLLKSWGPETTQNFPYTWELCPDIPSPCIKSQIPKALSSLHSPSGGKGRLAPLTT